MVKKNISYIAEIGINHNGSIDLAKKHIESAKESGATIAKFQTYKTESRVDFNSPIYEILKKCELSNENFYELKIFCDELDIKFSSTPFCEESAQFLKDIDCKIIKIASFHLRNLKLIKKILNFKNCEMLIISTGVSSSIDLIRVNNLYDSMLNQKLPELSFLHCISEYPISNIRNFNLSNIINIKKLTDKKVGYSDHSIGSLAASYAVALGSEIIEKHFTIDNQIKGADHSMSANPIVFKEMVEKCEEIQLMMGSRRLNKHYLCEEQIVQYRKEDIDII